MVVRRGWALALAVVIIHGLGVISGCGGGGSSADGGTTLPPKTLIWTPPESYTDGTPLDPMRDLDGYEIYVNESGIFTDGDAPRAFVGAVDTQSQMLITSFNLANLGPYLSTGVVYHVSMRAVAFTGIRSDFSPSASFSF